MANLVANAILPCLVKIYHHKVMKIFEAGTVERQKNVVKEFNKQVSILLLKGRYISIYYIYLTFALIGWGYNLGHHVFSDPAVHWGSEVFDSVDHPVSFIANRWHGFYTLFIIFPLLLHSFIFSTMTLKKPWNVLF